MQNECKLKSDIYAVVLNFHRIFRINPYLHWTPEESESAGKQK